MFNVQSWFLYLLLRPWCSCSSRCCWLQILSTCWLSLFSLFPGFLPHLELHATAGVFWLWQLNAVHALRCLYLFPKELYCGLCEVYWSVPAFCYVPHSSCVVHHVSRTFTVCCGFQGKKTHTFTLSMWDHNKTYFFNIMPFWTIVLKNVYFNIYLLHDLYIFVIYNWINFICCEIKMVGLGFIYRAAREITAESIGR